MKPGIVSAVAVLFCCAVVAIVGAFGYSRYKAAQAENAQFEQQQLQKEAQGQKQLFDAHMPDQLPPRASSAGAVASPAPQQ